MHLLNQIMFRIGVHAAHVYNSSYLASLMDPGLEVDTTIMGNITGSQKVFHTKYLYFVGAALVELVCIASILPTYWGWWKFGRTVSFSPIEIAKACIP